MSLSFTDTRHVIAIALFSLGTFLLIYSLWRHRRSPNNRTKLSVQLSVLLMTIGPYIIRKDIYDALSVSADDTLGRHSIEALAWIVFTYFVIRSISVFLWEGVLTVDGELLIPKFIVHISNILVIGIICIAFLHFVMNQNVTALATGTGALILGLGYLAKTPLESVFAGLSFSLSPMFRKGDHVDLIVDKGETLTGTVVDLGWLHLTLKAKEGHYIYVQNLIIEKSIVANFSRPSQHPSYESDIVLEYEFPMNRGLALIERALSEIKQSIPAFTVNSHHFERFGISYRIRFLPAKGVSYEDALNLIHQSIFYKIQQEPRFDFGYDKFNSVNASQVTDKATSVHQLAHEASLMTLEDRVALLGNVDIFTSLAKAEITQLAELCIPRSYGPPELVIQQGAFGDSMFVVAKGHVRVSLRTNGDAVELAVHGEGKYFGEMALLTGQPRGASVAAIDDVVLLEIPKEALRRILEKNPALAGEIANSVAKMQAQNEAILSAAKTHDDSRQKTRADAIRISVLRFFGLEHLYKE